ncbi:MULTISPECIES: GNAT family N-acetyltransferase [unclassified Paenibacillus]|uniref:GNAT family N-acetyltransferase n=1 Tax=unclassified Paenibacillus TaxID=185978 RepID=UPI001164562E|nr:MULTISPECIES: GNAT family N-acetyltransferase [unclassified Paenibacillus]AWP27327.1 alanine acetyltransferase [Paenibacillus sp. Cedars]MDH6670738.1 ribosomal-protein-alanine N-acetyltransferase [Paenibacillus sp. LBL]
MSIAWQTSRLQLKILDQDRAAEVVDFIVGNEPYFKIWEPVREPEYFTIGKQTELLAAERRSIADGTLFKVWLHQDDKIIGSVAVSNIVRGVFQSGHVGYKLAQSHTGKGYMTEALSAVVSHCFDTLEMHRLEANIMPRNAASLNVVRRLGFYEEGMAIKYLKINGVWEDHLHMVIRNERLE